MKTFIKLKPGNINYSIKKVLLKSTYWSLVGQFAYLGVLLISNIILARLLSPDEFGQIGIILFFIAIAQVLSESGLIGALVRNKDANEIDFSTIFVFNLFISFILFLLIVSSSGFIADYYKDQSLKPLLIVSSFIVIINAFRFVQNAKMIRQMRFKEIAVYELTSITIAATAGILLAINDFGAWSLVILQLSRDLIATTLFWIFAGGHGPWLFDLRSLKYHYKFGINTTLSSLLESVFDNIYQIILGKWFFITQTGLYYQAKKLQDIPISVIHKLTQTAIYSVLSKIHDDKTRFTRIYQQIIALMIVFVGFITLTLFVFAQDIILIFLGDQWLKGTFYLRVLSVVGYFNIQEIFNRILFKIYNNTGYILKFELIKKGIQSISIIIGLFYNNINLLMYGLAISSVLSYFVNNYIVQKKYPFLGHDLFTIVLKQISIILLVTTVTFNFLSGDGIFNNAIKFIFISILFVFLSVLSGCLNLKAVIKRLKT
jgi:O-antigen/teichoic acid export membrane protein